MCVCVCVCEDGGGFKMWLVSLAPNKIGICYFFADVKLFTVKMAKPAMAACISHVKGAIVDFVSCKLFIYKCFQILGLSSFNLMRFKVSNRGSEKDDWQMSDLIIVI